MKTISFEYHGQWDNDDHCQLILDKKQGTHFGCCCTCRHRKIVVEHFMMSNEKTLEFYICTALLHIKGDTRVEDTVIIVEKHGVCELHQNKEEKKLP